jgi:hypothetical protein
VFGLFAHNANKQDSGHLGRAPDGLSFALRGERMHKPLSIAFLVASTLATFSFSASAEDTPTGLLRIETSDRHGIIIIDGIVRAEGQFEGTVPVGDHKIMVVGEGYQQVELLKHVDEGSSSADVITLRPFVSSPTMRLATSVPAWRDAPEKDVAEVNQRDVARSGAIKTLSLELPKSFNGGSASGGGGSFSIGGTGKYLGVDVLGGLNIQTTEYPSKVSVSDYSAFAAVRLRGRVESRYFGASLATGPGVIYRVVGKQPNGQGVFSIPSDVQGASALGFTADLAGHLRLTESTDLTVGTMLWMEPKGLVTSADQGDFKVEKGLRVTMMPYVGFHFGP